MKLFTYSSLLFIKLLFAEALCVAILFGGYMVFNSYQQSFTAEDSYREKHIPYWERNAHFLKENKNERF